MTTGYSSCPLRDAAERLEAVRSNHEAASRIGTVEALECIDISEWHEAVEHLQQALAAPCLGPPVAPIDGNAIVARIVSGLTDAAVGRIACWGSAQTRGMPEEHRAAVSALLLSAWSAATLDAPGSVGVPPAAPSEAEREIAVANVAFLEKHGEYKSNYTRCILTERVGPKHYNHYRLLDFSTVAERGAPPPEAQG